MGDMHGIAKKKSGRSRSTAHPAKSKSRIRESNRVSVHKKPVLKRQASGGGGGGGGDKTIMTVNGRAIKQDKNGKMYVMKNDRKTYL